MGKIKARFWQKDKNNRIKCRLCHHFCLISEGQTGICRVRKNVGGKLYSLVYGRPAAINIDPIEKKPLYHFLPGSPVFSLGTLGCNFRCLNCQNYEISQELDIKKTAIRYVPAEEIVEQAIRSGCPAIAYTYNEPTIFAEYALDIMKLAHTRGFKNVWVSNGFMSADCLNKVLPLLDTANIDLKSMNDVFYRRVCSASVEPVLENLKRIKQAGVHLEITTLAIPTLSDKEEMFISIARFIADHLGQETPWHISRFSPDISWKLKSLEPTETKVIKRAVAAGRSAGLKYIYAGGIDENTYCPGCNEPVIKRSFYTTERLDNDGTCHKCKMKLNIIS